MLGVGGLSFSRGMGISVAMLGLTEKVGSRNDSLNFPLTFVPLEKDNSNKNNNKKKHIKGSNSDVKPSKFLYLKGHRQGVSLSWYSLASSDHFSSCVFDADLGKWDSLLFNLGYVERLPSSTLNFNQEDL